VKNILMCIVVGSALATTASGQEERPHRQPSREELRQDMQQQLERLQMRERWLQRQIESIDRGDMPERPQPGEGEPPHERDRGRELTAEDQAKFIAVLRDIQSDRGNSGEDSPFARILEKEGPERDRILRKLAPRLQRLVDLKDTDPERYEATKDEMIAGLDIAHAARKLSLELRNPEASEASTLEASNALREAIAKGFDARAAMTRYELQDVEQRLEVLTAEVSQAEAQRDERIEEQFQNMLRRIESGNDAALDSPDGPSRRGPQRGQKPSSRDD